MSDTREYKEALAALADMMKHDRDAFAQVLVEFIEPNHLSRQVLDLFLDTRSLDAGDVLVKKVRKGVEVHTLVPGAVHLAHEITISDRINFVLDGADVKVTYNEWELERGEIGTVESIRSEMRAKLQDFYVQKVFTAFSSVWSAANTPDNFTDVGGDITAAALEDAIDYINQNTAGARAIVGTRAAVTPITKFGAFWSDGTNVGWAEELIMEIYNRGFLGRYYGVPIVALDQVWDNIEDFNPLIPDDKVLVLGESVGEFITYGEVRTKQWTDMNPTPPQFMLELYQQFGMIIDNARGIYVLEVV